MFRLIFAAIVITAIAAIAVVVRSYDPNHSKRVPVWRGAVLVTSACLLFDIVFVILISECWKEASASGSAYYDVLHMCVMYSIMFVVVPALIAFSVIVAAIGAVRFRGAAWAYVLGVHAILVLGSLSVLWGLTR